MNPVTATMPQMCEKEPVARGTLRLPELCICSRPGGLTSAGPRLGVRTNAMAAGPQEWGYWKPPPNQVLQGPLRRGSAGHLQSDNTRCLFPWSQLLRDSGKLIPRILGTSQIPSDGRQLQANCVARFFWGLRTLSHCEPCGLELLCP